ncbi:MAG TPA: DNA internalization-related competence protein ComEC/Rec2 [Gemmatimonadaceae bacterium]|nr:DNA internalization-related competence protein ComEC/Rec2 [Gemmatimonadaceae bacterium]
MPLVAWAVSAYLCGLLAGFSGSSLAALAAAIGIAAAQFRRGAVAVAVLIVLVVAGVMAARADARAARACVGAAANVHPLEVTLGATASAGAFVPASLAGCPARVGLSVAYVAGPAPAGARVLARGDVVRTRTGLVVQNARLAPVAGPSLLARARAAAGRAIDATFGTDAPLVRALLIADRRELSPELRDRFAAAGMAHMLAIAGLHVGIIALTIVLALELCGVPRPRASAVAAMVVVGYVALIGAPVPAVRSATMLVAYAATRAMQRPTARWAIVAIGAAQPIVAPELVLDVGYQLSVVGVSAIIASAKLARRIGVERLEPVPRAIVGAMLATSLATVATAPIVAATFGRISLIAPLTNVVAGPLLAIVQPILLLGALASPVHAVAAWFADAAHPLLAALTFTADTASLVPGASVTVSPSPVAQAAGCVMSVAIIVACAARTWEPAAGVAAVCAALLVWLPLARSGSGMLELHVLDVGQGDAIALRTPHGHWILVDAGRAWRGGDDGRSVVLPYLGRAGGGPVDAFILSHPHTDHVGGAATIMHALHPRVYIDAAFAGPAGPYRASLEAARDDRVRWSRAHPGDSLAIDGVSLTLLAPDSAWTSRLDDPNLASVIVLVRFGTVRMLLMGDAERAEEEWLLRNASASLHADVLKVGHHGSSTSSSDAFLDAVAPRLALVSVGAGNSYGLPSASVMRDLASRGAQVLRTDRLGTIVAKTDGARLFVHADGDEWESSRGSVPPPVP